MKSGDGDVNLISMAARLYKRNTSLELGDIFLTIIAILFGGVKLLEADQATGEF